jgi:hypothetical protein
MTHRDAPPTHPAIDGPDEFVGPTLTKAQRRFASWMTDVLIYIVVLNLYVEYFEAKVIDSFTISILTAILLKGLLDLITAGKKRVLAWSRQREGVKYMLMGLFGVWLILFFSKFLILESVNFVFRESVELGNFINVMLLVAGMMVAREIVYRIFRSLGEKPSTA